MTKQNKKSLRDRIADMERQTDNAIMNCENLDEINQDFHEAVEVIKELEAIIEMQKVAIKDSLGGLEICSDWHWSEGLQKIWEGTEQALEKSNKLMNAGEDE